MSFISVLFALLLEQVRPLMPGNLVHAGMRAWVRWCSRNFDAGKPHHAWVAWGFAVVLPSVIAMGVYRLLAVYVGFPVAVVWSVAVLYVTLGFRQFSFHFTAIRDAITEGDEDKARELLAVWQQLDARELPRSELVRHVIEFSILAAHRHVFGVLAWFSVLAAFGLGPAGAVAFRLSEFVVRYWQHKSRTLDQPVSLALHGASAQAWRLIDWVPARITAMSFAVVGSFEEAIEGWRNYQSRSVGDNDGVILAATAGAVNVRLGSPAGPGSPDEAVGQTPEYAHLSVVVGLVWRTVVMWMVLLALLTLARLLG